MDRKRPESEVDKYFDPAQGMIDVLERPTPTSRSQRFAIISGPTNLFAVKETTKGTARGLHVSHSDRALPALHTLLPFSHSKLFPTSQPGIHRPFRLRQFEILVQRDSTGRPLHQHFVRSAHPALPGRETNSGRQAKPGTTSPGAGHTSSTSPARLAALLANSCNTAICPSTLVTLRRTE